jgi:protoheme IX farnesyltransferase
LVRPEPPAGTIVLASVLRYLIILFWTPPHFWALSLWRAEEYARAGIPMLPVVAGCAETRRQILLYAIVLAPVGASPWLLGYSGLIYGVTAIVAGAAMIACAARISAAGDGVEGVRAAKRLFGVSIVYLFVLFAALLIDYWLGGPGRVFL